jgi:transposase
LQCEPGVELPELDALRDGVLAGLPPKTPPRQISSIETLAARVYEMAERGAKPKAIFDKLVMDDAAFKGSLSAVKRLWKRWRKKHGVKAEDIAIPVDTLPGDVAQVDFGYVGRLVDPTTRKLRRAWVFTMVLGYSRHLFAKIVFDQKAETWVQLHIEAFAEFGGVPRTVVPDNLEAAVIRAAFGIDRDDADLNRTYCELARHDGFVVDPAPPRAPKKKEKVESSVRYVKSNFWKTSPSSTTSPSPATRRTDSLPCARTSLSNAAISPCSTRSGTSSTSPTTAGGLPPIVFLANDRCDQENLIAQLKNAVRALHAPVNTLVANCAYMAMASLGWTIKAWMALWLPIEPRWRAKHIAERDAWLRMDFRTFLHAVIAVPAQILLSGRRRIWRLLRMAPAAPSLFRLLDAL